MTSAFDVAVIGGGIVGLATALALSAEGSGSIVILEAEPALGRHQTGRNSGVIHSGIYYKPGSLKATLCVDGREAMFRFCEEHGVEVERCGKVVVATNERELGPLATLASRADANGLHGVRRIGPEELRELEPHARGIAALHVPETGIVRYADVLDAMARALAARGADLRLGARLLAARDEGDAWLLTTPGGDVRARNVVNCGGLQSDRIARMFGIEPGVRIIPFRGEYYDLSEERRGLVKNLIYPVPDARFPFLGVHLTRGTDGVVEAGPNAVVAFAREGYRWRDIVEEDVAETLRYLGFWNLVARHGRMGLAEVWRSLVKGAFVRAVQTLVPEVTAADLHPARAGVRAQAVEPSGALVDDFRISEQRGAIHVLNAPSPAATASLAIGRFIARRASSVLR